MTQREIGVVVCSRSDFAACMPLILEIQKHPYLKVKLVATGALLSERFGYGVADIEKEGFVIDERVESLIDSDKPEAIGESLGLGIIGFAKLFAQWRPDILVITGDRFDMYAAAVASLPFNIPLAHIAGGELTGGAIDDSLRHSLTKMSHLHFAQLEEYRQRIIQMGEEPWRVHTVGALSLDNLRRLGFLPE